MLRVAYESTVLCEPTPSGIGRYARALLHALAASGQVALTAWYRRSYRREAVHLRPPAGVPARWYQDPLWPLWSGAHIVHGPGVRTPRWRGVRVASLMDLTPFTNPGGLPPERLARDQRSYRAAAESCHLFLAISQATKDDAVRHLGIPPERIRVTWLGVTGDFRPRPADELAPLRQRLGLPERFLLSVGDLHPRKNLPRLIEALAASRCDLPLVLAGREAGDGDTVAATAARYGLSGRIIRLNYVAEADLAPLYAAAAGLCYPSLAEGFGFPIIEAMRSGIPVLTSDATSCPEVAGGHAVLVDPRSVPAISAGLHRLLEVDAARLAAARAWADGFTWERCAAQTIDTYRSAIAAA